MKDKLAAGFWAFVIALPLQALCCLGPAAVVSFVLSQIGGSGYVTTMLLLGLSIMAAAIVVQRAKRRRGAMPTNTHAPAHEVGGSVPPQCCPVGSRRTEVLGPVVVKVWTQGDTGRTMINFDPARAKYP